MNLLEIIAPGTLKVLGAAPYKWDCFGPNAVYFDAGTEQHQHLVSVIFDDDDGAVYAVEMFLPEERKAWRWIDERFVDYFLEACRDNRVNPRVAYDNVSFENVDSTELLTMLNSLTSTPGLDIEEDEEEDDPA
jgi:hypothetical protein